MHAPIPPGPYQLTLSWKKSATPILMRFFSSKLLRPSKRNSRTNRIDSAVSEGSLSSIKIPLTPVGLGYTKSVPLLGGRGFLLICCRKSMISKSVYISTILPSSKRKNSHHLNLINWWEGSKPSQDLENTPS